ncbi:copper amine oxidase family protein [Metarhizium robertsii]|uniref:Amine oxidase n=2 Tax=Metarhizium robertsii TaxID=568076 RepID=E9F3H7_METRA|nr:copper methylamine oxidase precursor [Metarhizium robertsii ARSEF 23]EFY97714.1 copper methylamine oxidase precursor [Metarhizium robertsii ARSEF 23]EXV05226.1 copper amine oxidase family protein [Metarhizium robertsii]
MSAVPHPLSDLSAQESNAARDAVLKLHPGAVIDFRAIYLLEPNKADVLKFLALEHAAKLTPDSPRPARLAQVKYDVIGGSEPTQYHESVINVATAQRVKHTVVGQEHHASLSIYEFERVVEVVKNSQVFQEKLKSIELPEGFELVVEPWPYGGPDEADGQTRLFQALCFGRDTRSGNPDSNFYAYPLPFIPIVDARKKEVIRIDQPATGGKGDALSGASHKTQVLDHCRSAEYVPELIPGGTRKDVKPLTVVQPEGASFTVSDENLIEWQKWRFRVTFNPREGAVLHDVRYDGRDVLYRLSISDMTVPYADPRAPFHRKQAFDFGDGGLGNCVNNLTLGCDCLGVIKYFDGLLTNPDGSAQVSKNVICLHEQDNGINWKHTNWRTGRAVVTRRRELVVQFIITLANYEYIFAFKLDQAAGITLEARATGIVSVVNIDEGKTAPWGNVVNPGTLAQNHQHIFCARIDPAVDGHGNSLVREESVPVAVDPATNPNGNLYEVQTTVVKTSAGMDLDPMRNRVFKVQNPSRRNPVSGKPVGYKITTPPTQLLLAAPGSIQSNRALFARHHLWVTKYRDDELYAGGRYTLQSRLEVDGLADAAARGDNVEDEDIVVWSVFGLTHNPRVEDWPVMPVEMLQVHITPSDFFTGNPAIDVPSSLDSGSKLANGECCKPAAVNGNGV